MILEEETFRKFGYFLSDLKPQSNKRIVAICDCCGKIRETNKNNYATLCQSCSHKGQNRPNWKSSKIKRFCEECGKEFEVFPIQIKRGNGRFCSYSCSDKAHKGKGSHSWKGGKVKRICESCGKAFLGWPSQVKYGYAKYCSQSCAAKVRRHNAKPQKTRPELIFEDICKRQKLPFIFVGDGSKWIGNANPDFIHNTRKLCIEIFGDYWHSPLLNSNIRYSHTLEGRKKQLETEGYKLIVIWETDLLREDAEGFVVNLLKK